MTSAKEIAEIVGDLGTDGLGAEMDLLDRDIWNNFVVAMQDQQEVLNSSYHASALTIIEKRTLQGKFNALDPNHDGQSIEDGFGSAEIAFNGLIVIKVDSHERKSVELKSPPPVKGIDRIPSATCKVETLDAYPNVGDRISFLGLGVIRMGYGGAEDFREYIENNAGMFVPADNLVKR